MEADEQWALATAFRPPDDEDDAADAPAFDGAATVELSTVHVAFRHAMEEVGAEVARLAAANGRPGTTAGSWEPRYKVPAMLALVHAEASQALEAFRRDDREGFLAEMADVVLQVMECTHGLGMSLGDAVVARIERDRARGFRLGGERI